MRILLTGGHLSPALGVIDEIENKSKIVFVGRKYSLETEKSLSLEYQEVTNRKIKFYNLSAGRLTRLMNFRSLLNLIRLPLGFYQSFRILKTEKPGAILSFGGYLGFSVGLLGYLLGIPVFIHEQTINPGLSNRIIGKISRKIFLAFDDTIKFFPKDKIIITGNPVRKTLLRVEKKPIELKKTKPVIYFTGGSLGSHSINIILEKILVNLLKKYQIIHQTGNIKQYKDKEKLENIKNSLPTELKNNYFLSEHFYEEELGYIYSISDLVVGRSGANTFFELIAWEKPAILIPLPWSANQEQLKHAMIFQKTGTGKIFYQSGNPSDLEKLIDDSINKLNFFKNNFKLLKKLYKKDAAKVIIQTIENTLD